MKIVLLVEGPSDANTLKVLVKKILGEQANVIPKPRRGRGNLLKAEKVLKYINTLLRRNPDVSKIIVCVDSECTPEDETEREIKMREMKKEFLCHLILLTSVLLGFGLKIVAQVEHPDEDGGAVATIQETVTDSKRNPIKGAIVTTKLPTSQAITQPDRNYRIFFKARSSETLQSKLQKKWPAMLSSFILFPIGTRINIGFAERKFRSSARDAKREFYEIIPISTSDYRLRMQSWEQYQRKKTRANWLSVTAGNLMLDSIPFYWHWVKGKPIKWKLALIYYGPQVVTFGTWSIIDWIRADDAQDRANASEQALRYHEATVRQGEKGKFRERAEWLAANAVLDVALGFLATSTAPV